MRGAHTMAGVAERVGQALRAAEEAGRSETVDGAADRAGPAPVDGHVVQLGEGPPEGLLQPAEDARVVLPARVGAFGRERSVAAAPEDAPVRGGPVEMRIDALVLDPHPPFPAHPLPLLTDERLSHDDVRVDGEDEAP